MESKNDELKHNPATDGKPPVGSSVSLAEYKRQLRKEQLYYPALKFQKIREDFIENYWRLGMSPTDACNDILTAV